MNDFKLLNVLQFLKMSTDETQIDDLAFPLLKDVFTLVMLIIMQDQGNTCKESKFEWLFSDGHQSTE